MGRFEELLKALGEKIGLPLHPDANGACKLRIDGKMNVQIEEMTRSNDVLMASRLCEVPPGKPRENIFREALKANHKATSSPILGYLDRTNELTLHILLPWEKLSVDTLIATFELFVAIGESWQKAITQR